MDSTMNYFNSLIYSFSNFLIAFWVSLVGEKYSLIVSVLDSLFSSINFATISLLFLSMNAENCKNWMV
jgi:fucose permease